MLFIAGSASALHAADHLEAPAVMAAGMGDIDINDLYAFQSPTNPDNSVLIMTVNPFAGVMSGRTFEDQAEYQFQIDNDGDAVADITYATTFTTGGLNSQTLTTTRDDGTGPTAYAMGTTASNIATASGGTLRAGLFEDPFFFDLAGFSNGFAFTGDDAFAGADITAIVLEVPSSELGGPNIGVWARTLDASGMQFDRMGRPTINTALIPSGMKDAFNQGAPADDPANFGAAVEASLLSLNGGDATHASDTAALLLPDVLTFDTSDASGFLNGRRLEDDVIDAALGVVSNGGVTTDLVDSNDVAFLGNFPYLAAPNAVPEPSTFVLAVVALAALAFGGLHRRRSA